MFEGHDPYLVALSVAVAILGGYTGFGLTARIRGTPDASHRLLLAGAAFFLAIGIWTMHFVGMLAAPLPPGTVYLVLPTIVSFLICALVVGISLFFVSVGEPPVSRVVSSAVLLGVGIAVNSQRARLASAVVIALTIGKAFLVDMSTLTGVYRALSFMCLGLVLVAIGWLYQRILFRRQKPPPVPAARVALLKSLVMPQTMARKIRPPSSGNPGARLKSPRRKLVPARYAANAATLSSNAKTTLRPKNAPASTKLAMGPAIAILNS